MRQYKGSLYNCRKCKNWVIRENFKKWNQITVGDCLTFPVSQQWFQVLVPWWASTNACHLIHGIQKDYRTRFVVVNFFYIRFVPKSSSRNSPLYETNRDRTSSTNDRDRDLFRKRGRKNRKHNSNADIGKKAVDHEFINTGGKSAEFYGWTAKTENFGTAIRQTL